jgi:hypothetical protein
VGQAHSLPSFGLCVGWCGLVMCVSVGLAIHFSFFVIIYN